MTSYKLLKDRFDYKAGTIVYRCDRHNYGCVQDDNRETGVEHMAVTLNIKGEYPFFTIPVRDLEKINAIEKG